MDEPLQKSVNRQKEKLTDKAAIGSISEMSEEDKRNLPKSFVELYKLGCKLSNDPLEEHLPMYQDMDNLIKFINEHPESKLLKYSISDTRLGVFFPYDDFIDKRRPPDDFINGRDVIFICLGFDTYVSMIIDRMDNSHKNPMVKDIKSQIKWKLLKLDLAFKDWNAYVQRYLEPFKSSDSWDKYLLKISISSSKNNI
jgi:hypothetical protein